MKSHTKKNISVNCKCCMIKNLRQYGIICYRVFGYPKTSFKFASQIFQDQELFVCFDEYDQNYIANAATAEIKDTWYVKAGELLNSYGIDNFDDHL